MKTPEAPDSSDSVASDFNLSFTVPQTPAEVYAAIVRVPEWWIGEVDGSFASVGATFVYAYKHFHRTAQRVTELQPGRVVAWVVTESSINFVEEKEEWKGTTIRFEIVPAEGGSELRFTHVGLTPRIACYANCSAGWEFYILESLRSLITTGKGVQPPF